MFFVCIAIFFSSIELDLGDSSMLIGKEKSECAFLGDTASRKREPAETLQVKKQIAEDIMIEFVTPISIIAYEVRKKDGMTRKRTRINASMGVS